jgi:hypothetical protein
MKFRIVDLIGMAWVTDAATPERSPDLVVSAPTWFDARSNAAKLWATIYPHVDPALPLDAVLADPGTEPLAELEWRGSDAGSHPNKTMWMRTRATLRSKWSEWRLACG